MFKIISVNYILHENTGMIDTFLVRGQILVRFQMYCGPWRVVKLNAFKCEMYMHHRKDKLLMFR